MQYSFKPKPVLLFLMIITIMLTISTTYAAPDNTLTLPAAVQLALSHDYQVVSASNDLEKARLAVKLEMLKIFPQATIETSYGYEFERNDYPKNIILTLKETIPSKMHVYGDNVASALETSLWDQITAETQLQIDQATVVYNTTVQYVTILKDQKIIELQTATLKNAQAASDLATKQLQLGQITKPDQLKAQGNLATAQFNLEKSKQDLFIAQQQLGNEVGRSDMDQVQLTEPQNLDTPLTPDYQQFKVDALQHRLETQQAQISTKKAEQLWAQANNQGLPALNVNYINSNETNNYAIGYNLLSGDFTWNASHQENGNRQGLLSNADNNNLFTNKSGIAFKLSWTFDFGLAKNQAMQAQLSLNSARANQDKIKQDILLDVNQSSSAYQVAVLQTATNQQNVPYYQKTLEVKQLQLKLGGAMPLDVATAQNDLFQAQVEVIKATYDQKTAYQKLLLASGRLYPFGQNPGQSSGGTSK